MQVIHGPLDYRTPWARPDVYLFTGNPIVNARGRLVMGRGAAKECRDGYPSCDRWLARVVRLAVEQGKHLAFVPLHPGQALGWFQVKDHWRNAAQPPLIEAAARELAALAAEHPALRFHLNAPGIGNGRLSWQDVAPLLAPLPDNVLVYRVP